MRPLIALALALTVLGAAACSGSDEAEPPTTAAATTSTSAAPVVDSSEPEATTSTQAPASTSTTVVEPTTTSDPTEALIVEIEADLNAGEQALIAAGANPSDTALRATVSRYFSDAGLERVTTFLDGLVSEGLLTRTNPDVPNVIVVEEVRGLDSSAEASICRVDAVVVYEPIGGSEAIVDDRIVRTRTRIQLSKIEGTWTSPGDGETFETEEGATECE